MSLSTGVETEGGQRNLARGLYMCHPISHLTHHSTIGVKTYEEPAKIKNRKPHLYTVVFAVHVRVLVHATGGRFGR